MTSELTDLTLEQLEREIRTSESRIDALRDEFCKRLGHPPPRSLRDREWRWTIFMVLGFAFIASMVYLLGIAHYGEDVESGIPSLFYNTDIAYFAILTFYILIMALVIQIDRVSAHQAWGLILGYWCAHWLIYDWAWWAIELGLGLKDPATFFNSTFSQPIFIPNPPMWFFLITAILCGFMALYTFTIPDRLLKLLPVVIWLYVVYLNASIGVFAGLDTITIFAIGALVAVVAFCLAIIFTIQRVRRGVPAWLGNWAEFKRKMRVKNWSSNPLSLPWVLILISMLFLMHLFLVLLPVVGLFLGMLPWYFVPLSYVIWRSSNVKKMSKGRKIGVGLGIIALMIILVIALSLYAG